MPGTHSCAVPRTFDEAFAIAAAFLARGLERGQLCLYVADDNEPEIIRMALKSHGLAVEDLEKSGRLILLRSADAPLARPMLDAEYLYRAWSAKTDEAVSAGFAGLRVAVEMTWALEHDPEVLAGYELGSGPLFAAKPLDALCVYNWNLFQERSLAAAAVGGHSSFYEDRTLEPRSAEEMSRAIDLLS